MNYRIRNIEKKDIVYLADFLYDVTIWKQKLSHCWVLPDLLVVRP